MKRLFFLTILSAITALIAVPTAQAQEETECAALFQYREDAQSAFDLDPVGASTLDGDGDGVVCESLPLRASADVAADGDVTVDVPVSAVSDQYAPEETTVERTNGEQTIGEETVSEQTSSEDTTAEETVGGGGTDEEKTRRERREKREKTGDEGTAGGAGETASQDGGVAGSANGEGPDGSGAGQGNAGEQEGVSGAVNDAVQNLRVGRLPETGGGWAALLIAGAVLIGGGWLLVRRFSS